MGAQVAAGDRGVAAAVSAWTVQWGFRPGARTVPGYWRRALGGLDHPADAQWQDEAHAFGQRDLSGTDYVYLWVDGIHLKVRLDQEKLCLLVMIGVRADGRKELVAWPTVTANPANRGPICCATAAGAG